MAKAMPLRAAHAPRTRVAAPGRAGERWRVPPTLDLGRAEFSATCRLLALRVREYAPDVVVGIATGGVHVARAMVPQLPGRPALATITLQRPSTAVKSHLGAGLVLAHAPRPVSHLLRWLEVEAREALLRDTDGRDSARVDDHPPDELAGLRDMVGTARRLLVVDDTVDSGRTLSRTLHIVRAINPATECRTAVLTSTFRDPPVRPDYLLYERTLIRFPWSLDT